MVPAPLAFVLLAVAFAAQGAWDSLTLTPDAAPAWFRRIRIRMTILVVAALVVAFVRRVERSTGPQHGAGNREDAVGADHVGHQHVAPEQPGIGAVEHVERAGIGAEGRHDQPVAVGGEAAAAHRTAALDDAGARMQVPGDLAGRGAARRLVAEDQAADPSSRTVSPGRFGRHVGIVIAGDPEPLPAGHQRFELRSKRQRAAARRPGRRESCRRG